jgi:hypothetical protein
MLLFRLGGNVSGKTNIDQGRAFISVREVIHYRQLALGADT